MAIFFGSRFAFSRYATVLPSRLWSASSGIEMALSRFSPRISTLALMPVRKESPSSSSATSTLKTLIFSTSFADGATKRTFPVKTFCGYASSVMRTGWPTWTLAMSTSLRLTRMISDFRSATVKSTVPALKDETPEVTVSPSSTPLLDDDAATSARSRARSATRRCRRSGCRGPRRSGSASCAARRSRRPGRA